MLNELLEYLSQTIPQISHGYFREQRTAEYCSPSPFRMANDNKWGGEDGLIWFFNPSKGGLRVWDRKLGISAPMQQVVEDFIPNPPKFDWKKIEEEVRQLGVTSTKQFNAVDTDLIDFWHKNVSYEYWLERGLSKELVDYFRLGYGAAIPNSPHRHVIPIKIANTQWTYATRLDDELAQKDNPYLAKHRNQVGSGHVYTIDNYTSTDTTTLYIMEGAMSFLSAVQMGFFPALFTNGGSSVWLDSWTVEILKNRPKLANIIFLQDNDTAGLSYVKRIMSSFEDTIRKLELVRKLNYQWLDTSVYVDVAEDCADILQRHGVINGRKLIEENIEPVSLEDVNPRFSHNRYIHKLQPLEEDKVVHTLDELRSIDANTSLTKVMTNFVLNYRRLYKGKAFIIAAQPGTGKNYALINMLQAQAKMHMEGVLERERESVARAQSMAEYLRSHKNNMNAEEIEAYERVIKRLLKPKKRTYAIVASPFKESFFDMQNTHDNFDKSLWFYFESRSKENCDNFEKADKAQRLGFNVSQEVCHFCPFKVKCEQAGYLSQFTKMEQYPIVSVRHQHLVQESLANSGKLLVIDESPLPVMVASNRVEAVASDIMLPTGWQEYLTQVEIRAITQFVTVIRNLVLEGSYQKLPNGRIRTASSGKELFDRLEVISQQNFSLSIADVLNALTVKTISDIVMSFSETLASKSEEHLENYKIEGDLPRRCLDIIYSVLADELVNFLSQKDAWNSKIMLEGNTLYVTPISQLAVSPTKPVLVLDATPIKSLYDRLLTDRDALVYSPNVRNPDTKTTVLYGNGFGITKLSENIRKANPDDVNAAMPNNYMRISFDAIKKLSEKHSSLLVVTHKAIAVFLQRRWAHERTNCKVAFVNFRGVRGLNTYANMEAVLVIGTPIREPLSFIRDTTAWFANDVEPLNFDIHSYVDMPYNGHVSVIEDGVRWQDGFKIRTFADKRVSEVYTSEIIAEMQQVAARIRPHTSNTPKHVYILSSFPAIPYVTDTVYYNNFIYDLPDKSGLEDFAYKWVEHHLKTYGKFPGQLKFAAALRAEGKFKVAENSARELLLKIKSELGQF